MSEGRKDDTGKLPYHLLPSDAIEEIVKVLAFGAKKYTSNSPVSLVELHKKLGDTCSCGNTTNGLSATLIGGTQQRVYASLATQSSTQKQNAQHAIQTGLPLSADCAGPATITHSSSETQGTPSGSAPLLHAGQNSTKIESPQPTRSTYPEVASRLGPLSTPEPGPLLPTDLPSTTKLDYLSSKEMSAASANPPQAGSLISTTTTKPGGSEGSYAIDATKVLDYSEILRNLLSAHSLTCAVRKLNIAPTETGYTITQTGERNWERGMAWSRPFSALMRHVWAWWRGQETDPETGYSHLAHAGCCVLFLLAYQLRRVGSDDRPIGGSDETRP